MNSVLFPIYLFQNKKRMRTLKIQSKDLLKLKMVVYYLKFIFQVEVEIKSKYNILNYVFQIIKNTKCHFG